MIKRGMMKKYDAYKDSGVKWIGEIPNHWEAIKISRVHPIIGSGTTPLSSREDYYSEKVSTGFKQVI